MRLSEEEEERVALEGGGQGEADEGGREAQGIPGAGETP